MTIEETVKYTLPPLGDHAEVHLVGNVLYCNVSLSPPTHCVFVSLSLSLLTYDRQIVIHPMYTADIMGNGVEQNTMGLQTVCNGTTCGRDKRVQFGGCGILTTGPPPHIWDS